MRMDSRAAASTREGWRRSFAAMTRDAAREGFDSPGDAQAPGGAARRAIRQQRPFRTPSQEATLSVLIAAERVRRRITSVVEPYGITTQQYNVLRILRGSHPAPLPTLEIGVRMIEATPGVTRLLDRLEEKGWVSRARCREDRRQVHCRITDAGLDLLTSLEPHIDALDEEVSAVLSPDEMKTLGALLDRLIEHFGGEA